MAVAAASPWRLSWGMLLHVKNHGLGFVRLLVGDRVKNDLSLSKLVISVEQGSLPFAFGNIV